MEVSYIKAPQSTQPITITKGKVKKVKRAKWEEVPIEYRKKRPEKLISLASEILLHIIGLLSFIRKGIGL